LYTGDVLKKHIQIWETLAGTALRHFELQTAMKACEELRNVVNLSRLRRMEDTEDKNLLSAKVLKLSHEYTNAFVISTHCLEFVLLSELSISAHTHTHYT
jgi:hypothetical protein